MTSMVVKKHHSSKMDLSRVSSVYLSKRGDFQGGNATSLTAEVCLRHLCRGSRCHAYYPHSAPHDPGQASYNIGLNVAIQRIYIMEGILPVGEIPTTGQQGADLTISATERTWLLVDAHTQDRTLANHVWMESLLLPSAQPG